MSAAATPLRDQMSPWKYELLMADLYAPLDVVCECDAQEYAYQAEFRMILSSEKLGKYDDKQSVQDGVVWASFEDQPENREIYQLLLSNSADDAQKLELMLNIAWWKAARAKAVENVDGGSDDDFDDQPQIGFSLNSGGISCRI